MAAESLDDQPIKILDIVTEFDKKLRLWKDSLPLAMRPKDRLKQFQASQDARSLEETILHCSYYDLIMVLYAPLTYPWITKRFRYDSNTNVRAKVNAQIAQSSEAMVEAARNVIIMTRNFEINGANTHAYTYSAR